MDVLHVPVLADVFTAWVDVQDLVYHRCIEDNPSAELIHKQQSLHTARQAMSLSSTFGSSTRAANDSTRILQVLAALMQSVPLSLPGPRGPRLTPKSTYSKLPRPDREKHPYALRISPSDGGRFPPRSPREVLEEFRNHEGLRAVGLNWGTECVRREGVRIWWLAFSTEDALRKFHESVQGDVFEGTALDAVLDFRETDLRAYLRVRPRIVVSKPPQ
ncbi:hypothetical protein P171DRAFT_511787 [Karstenula rhodostoma CBS 690.94]|uniref:Uncharacterized protein n=1 Tax=Karstenula rhodostoma CBS 690.94 TaxID=1392251 RepID=A0A9P4PLD0_9PLEO|nr:hypothetical protein P171DRAFT_511787 [Karstenula rhodostoma CBS 690.94]